MFFLLHHKEGHLQRMNDKKIIGGSRLSLIMKLGSVIILTLTWWQYPICQERSNKRGGLKIGGAVADWAQPTREKT